jgi:hypothetical protein
MAVGSTDQRNTSNLAMRRFAYGGEGTGVVQRQGEG